MDFRIDIESGSITFLDYQLFHGLTYDEFHKNFKRKTYSGDQRLGYEIFDTEKIEQQGKIYVQIHFIIES